MRADTFFTDGVAEDPSYVNVRAARFPQTRQGRERVEHLFQLWKEYLDDDLPRKAMSDFHSAFWELYLAHALALRGKTIVERWRRRPRRQGPDLLVAPSTWIEAVAPGCGTGTDALQAPEMGVAYEVPDERFILRLSSVLHSKFKKFRRYIDRKLVHPEHPVIVAVSGAKLEFRYQEGVVPRIVSAVFPLGALVVTMSKDSGDIVNRRFQYRPEITKQVGHTVCTTLFTDDQTQHISAVLYSTADCVNYPDPPGSDLILVHNPYALNPLGLGWLEDICGEYWFEEGQLRWNRPPVQSTMTPDPRC